jgi:hypothetical protein
VVVLFGACLEGAGDYHCPGAGQHVIEMCLNPPTFVAYRDGDGVWQTPVVANGTYKLCVADDYVLETVYVGSNGFSANAFASTYAETIPAVEECVAEPQGPPISIVAVTGQMTQVGSVWIDSVSEGLSNAAPWSYTLDVGAGVHDVIASNDMYGMPGNVLIRRGQDFEATTVEPNIDVVADGTPMAQVSLSVAGLEVGDSMFSSVNLSTSSTYAFEISQQGSGMADLAPTSLLLPTDEQELDVDAGQGSVPTPTSGEYHDAYTTFTGTETSFTLMPYLTGITFTAEPAVSATWSSLPASYTTVSVYRSASFETANQTLGTNEIYASATQGWIDVNGATSLGFDLSAPGYDPAWNIGSNYREDFTVDDDSTSVYYDTGVDQTVGD